MSLSWTRMAALGTKYYVAENLEKIGFVTHGFSTRLGGFGMPPYDTLNLSLAVGDDKSTVLNNRKIFAKALGVDEKRLVVPHQTHTKNVLVVRNEHVGTGAIDHSTAVQDVDALVTDIPNITLSLHFADCVPVLIVDPKKKVVANVHAGWKGTALEIAKECVEVMAGEFKCRPQDLQAAIGPSIGPKEFEVDGEAKDMLQAVFSDSDGVLQEAGGGKWTGDLKLANKVTLVRSGLEEKNIALGDKCTVTDKDEFFSFRREGTTGRMSAWIAITL